MNRLPAWFERAENLAIAVCYNLVHAYVVPGLLLLSYVLSGSRWVGFRCRPAVLPLGRGSG